MSLVLDDIGKTVRGDMHLAGISLTVAPGSLHVILGRTRAGKSSLLRMIAGLDRPTTGRIRWQGADITSTPARERSVAMVYQQFINYPSLTVRENIASPLRVARAPRDQVDARVRELAAALRLDALLDRLPGQISGGQQQRVAIARALAKRAGILLLDEPLVNLDYKLREELRDELRAILEEGATTALYATSDPAEALALGGHTMVLHQGRLLQHAPALEVYHRPATVEVARLASDPPVNLFPVQVSGGVAVLSPEVRIPLRMRGGGQAAEHVAGHLADLVDGAYCLGIRASHCTLREGGVPVRARVELSEIAGSETFVYLRHGETSFIVQEDGVSHHELGEERTFYMDPAYLMAFAPDGEGALVASYRAPGVPDVP